MSTVIGLDLSLASTGICIWCNDRGGQIRVETVRTSSSWRDEMRWEHICAFLWGYVDQVRGDYALVAAQHLRDIARSRPPDVLVAMEQRININPRAELVDGKARVANSTLRGNTVLDLAELRGVIRYGLYRRGVPYVDIAPGTLKVYATGNGKATKDAMVLAAERALGTICPVNNNNEADSLWLTAMTVHHYGRPLCTMPTRHLGALSVPDWPEWRIDE